MNKLRSCNVVYCSDVRLNTLALFCTSKNIDFDSLPENLFQNLFFSVSCRFKRVDGKQSQRKGEDEFLRGAPREGQVHTSLKIFQRPFNIRSVKWPFILNFHRFVILDLELELEELVTNVVTRVLRS